MFDFVPAKIFVPAANLLHKKIMEIAFCIAYQFTILAFNNLKCFGYATSQYLLEFQVILCNIQHKFHLLVEIFFLLLSLHSLCPLKVVCIF